MSEDSPLNFGQFLRERRLARQMSLRQLALYAGCSDSYLSMLERGKRGKRGATPAFLLRLSKPLRVSYDDLLVVAGYKTENEPKDLQPRWLTDEQAAMIFRIEKKLLHASPNETRIVERLLSIVCEVIE